MYATNREFEKKTFTVKIQNIKETIDIQVAFISENKLQKKAFLSKI